MPTYSNASPSIAVCRYENSFVHLTNYSINKFNDKFEQVGGEGIGHTSLIVAPELAFG